MSVGAVTGLASEARIARQIGLKAEAGGGSAQGTRAAIARLLAQGVTGLLSFGIAGALAEGLVSATLLLPGAVCTEQGEGHWVDLDWHMRLVAAARAKGIAAVVGGMLGANEIAATSNAKAALHRSTGALAVDLESHLVAREAARAHLPFAILRVVADPVERDLPPAALAPLWRNGYPNLIAVLGSVARRPSQIPALLSLARETKLALDALLQGGQALGAALIYPLHLP